MPNIPCIVCSHKHPIPYLNLRSSGQKIIYFRCPECSLVFQDPGTPFIESEIYNADYILKKGQDTKNPRITRPREKTAEHYYRWVEKHSTKGNLLEIGCATGLALRVAQAQGWNVFGVEVNKQAALIANEVLKADVVQVGHLNDEMFPDGFFSLITLFDVIEHIPCPVEFLSILHKKLAPGGKILFVTPNVDTLSFKILKDKWPHFVQEHLVLFSPKSIKRLLKETGFMPQAHGWATKFMSIEMLKTHAENHPDAFLYKPISWILGKTPGLNEVAFPFNVGEMYVLAEKIS